MAENRCRICMVSKSHQVYLFNAGFDLPSKIMEVADVLVKEGDGLPATVCVDCEADLVKCHQFRTQVRVADQQFRAGLTRQEFPLKQEPEHIIEDTNDGDLNKTEDLKLADIEDEAVTTEPLSHVDVIETSQKTEISDDPFGQEEPLIEAENKLDNEPPLDPLTYVKVEPGLMEIDDSAGPSTSSMVKGDVYNSSRPTWMEFPQDLMDNFNYSNLQQNHQQSPGMSSYATPRFHFTSVEDYSTMNFDSLDNVSAGVQIKAEERFKTQGSLPIVPDETDSINKVRDEEETITDVNKQPATEVETESNNCFCTFCDITFWTPELFNQHKREKSYICRICTAGLKSHSELENHFDIHKSFKCRVCKNVFTSRKDIYNHRLNSLTCRPAFECEFCKRRFSNSYTFSRHKRVFHIGEKKDAERNRCVVCRKTFKLPYQLDYHYKICHTAFEDLECELCGVVLIGPDRLKLHIKNIHLLSKDAIFPCPTCGKVFKRNYALLTHVKSVHKEKSVCICELCGKSCLGEQALDGHMRHEHKDVGNFKCELCEKHFNTSRKLRKHFLRSHREISNTPPPVMCEVCGKSFGTKHILKHHLLVHTGEKPFKCQLCGAAFSQKSSLRTHGRIHSNTNKYSCESCGQAFRWKQTFDKHKNKCETMNKDV